MLSTWQFVAQRTMTIINFLLSRHMLDKTVQTIICHCKTFVSLCCLQHAQVRANPVVARTISQSSVSTPIKPSPAVTVKMPAVTPLTSPIGASTTITTPSTLTPGSVSKITVKQEPSASAGTHTVQKTGVTIAGVAVSQVGTLCIEAHVTQILNVSLNFQG